MINRDELKTSPPTAVVALAVNEVTVGSPIPQNHRRFIYRVKFINSVAGPNAVSLGKRENGAGVTTAVDVIQAAVVNEVVEDPEELMENSAPIYVIDGPPGQIPVVAGNNSLVRAYTDNGAGIFTYWYIDAPA
jgi:hypothetical protein